MLMCVHVHVHMFKMVPEFDLGGHSPGTTYFFYQVIQEAQSCSVAWNLSSRLGGLADEAKRCTVLPPQC